MHWVNQWGQNDPRRDARNVSIHDSELPDAGLNMRDCLGTRSTTTSWHSRLTRPPARRRGRRSRAQASKSTKTTLRGEITLLEIKLRVNPVSSSAGRCSAFDCCFYHEPNTIRPDSQARVLQHLMPRLWYTFQTTQCNWGCANVLRTRPRGALSSIGTWSEIGRASCRERVS